MTKLKEVARALAKCHGDDWDDLPDDKSHWVEHRGQFGGRFRDVNERFRCDYLDEARAAIEAMREPTPAMREAAAYYLGSVDIGPAWQAAMDAALSEEG